MPITTSSPILSNLVNTYGDSHPTVLRIVNAVNLFLINPDTGVRTLIETQNGPDGQIEFNYFVDQRDGLKVNVIGTLGKDITSSAKATLELPPEFAVEADYNSQVRLGKASTKLLESAAAAFGVVPEAPTPTLVNETVVAPGSATAGGAAPAPLPDRLYSDDTGLSVHDITAINGLDRVRVKLTNTLAPRLRQLNA